MPGSITSPPISFQYSLMASCRSKVGEFVITRCLRSWWMTCRPAMYSTIALSPVRSDIDRCRVARRSWPGTVVVRTARGVAVSAMTASATDPNMSSTYWAQRDSARAGAPSSAPGYCDSASQRRLAASPASLTPSVELMSYPEAITLP